MKKINYFLSIFLFLCFSATAEIQVYFSPSSDCQNQLIKKINTSVQSIDIAIYSFTDKDILSALIQAANRGVQIRIIADKKQALSKSSVIPFLYQQGFDLKLNSSFQAEHNKFAIFDQKHVMTGSYNWTKNARDNNSENCVFFDENIQAFTERFEFLWQKYDELKTRLLFTE